MVIKIVAISTQFTAGKGKDHINLSNVARADVGTATGS